MISVLQINWGFSRLHLLKRANWFLNAREMNNTECQQNHKNPLIVQFEQYKCWWHKRTISWQLLLIVNRKDIRCCLSSINQNTSRTANCFHTIIYALLQLWINNICTFMQTSTNIYICIIYTTSSTIFLINS